MLIGIIANITKENVFEVVSSFIRKLKANGLDYILTSALAEEKDKLKIELDEDLPADDSEIYEKSDIIISIGGDGTMLSTAFHAHFYDKPVLGINLGKLGFLVETDIKNIDQVIELIKNKDYTVEERMVIEGVCDFPSSEKLYAVNDIVIEKGGWSKMIELTAWVDGEYVTTFSNCCHPNRVNRLLPFNRWTNCNPYCQGNYAISYFTAQFNCKTIGTFKRPGDSYKSRFTF